jgi:hypothetical protein
MQSQYSQPRGRNGRKSSRTWAVRGLSAVTGAALCSALLAPAAGAATPKQRNCGEGTLHTISIAATDSISVNPAPGTVFRVLTADGRVFVDETTPGPPPSNTPWIPVQGPCAYSAAVAVYTLPPVGAVAAVTHVVIDAYTERGILQTDCAIPVSGLLTALDSCTKSWVQTPRVGGGEEE